LDCLKYSASLIIEGLNKTELWSQKFDDTSSFLDDYQLCTLKIRLEYNNSE